jgi:hypothetical protein
MYFKISIINIFLKNLNSVYKNLYFKLVKKNFFYYNILLNLNFYSYYNISPKISIKSQ